MTDQQEEEADGALSNWQLARIFLASPGRGFAELKRSPRIALPFLGFVLGTAAVLFWYLSIVDFAWLKDQYAANIAATSGRESARLVEFMSRDGLKWGTSISAMTTTSLLLLGAALYLRLAGSAFRIRHSYRQWLAFCAWSNSPSIIELVAIAAVLLLANVSQVDANSLQPLSLNELFFHVPVGDPLYPLLTRLTLFTFLQLWLAVVGLRVWTGRSLPFCAVYIGVPYALFYAVFAFAMSPR